MVESIVQNQLATAAQKIAGERGAKIIRGIEMLAAKQGGQTAIENYQLLAKRAAIAVGAAVVVINVVAWIGGSIMSRKRDEELIEKTVRRVVEEERAQQAATV